MENLILIQSMHTFSENTSPLSKYLQKITIVFDLTHTFRDLIILEISLPEKSINISLISVLLT